MRGRAGWMLVAALALVPLGIVGFELTSIWVSVRTAEELCHRSGGLRVQNPAIWGVWSKAVQSHLRSGGAAAGTQELRALAGKLRLKYFQISQMSLSYPRDGVWQYRMNISANDRDVAVINWYSAQTEMGTIQRFIFGRVGPTTHCKEYLDDKYAVNLQLQEFNYLYFPNQ